MARYTGPKVRVSRRLGTNIFENEKGRKALERKALEPNDGFKFYRAEGSWRLIRFSGTEALLRVYAEARSPEDVEALLAEGRAIAGEGA